MKKTKGFGLIELVITILLVSALASSCTKRAQDEGQMVPAQESQQVDFGD